MDPQGNGFTMAMQCPTCQVGFKTISNQGVSFSLCPSCQGIAVTFYLLKRHMAANDARVVWASREQAGLSALSCPSCQGAMITVDAGSLAPFSLCKACLMTFFSATQKQRLPKLFQACDSQNQLMALTPQEREEYAEALLGLKKPSDPLAKGAPPSLIKILWGALFLFVPEKDFPPLRAAKVTASLLLGMLFVTALTFVLRDKDYPLLAYVGFRPWGFFDNWGANFFLSFFAHGSFWHFFANAFYLRMFAPRVEEKLGTKDFLWLILACEIAGDVLFSFTNFSFTNKDTPTMGASGALMGILTFYGLAFPSERVGIYFFPLFRWLWFPAGVVLIVLVLANIGGATMQANSGANINYLAHLGGILAGFAFWLAKGRSASRGG